MDMYGFYTGKIFDAYEFLGCHLDENGAMFRTFAPAAERISVIGEFSDWNEIPMQKAGDGNFWECWIEGVSEGQMYKYKIYRKDGGCIDHCDPYGYGMELRPNSASVVRDLYKYKFKDDKWMKARSDHKDKPLNIYEIHAGSWRTAEAEEWLNYEELAKQLIPYVKEMGYNYIELMPIAEHPCDESWGYQNTGFYSPTSRYGTMDDLKKFVDECHQADIGVLLDFVPVHFAIDAYGLADYDGTPLYEYPHVDVGNSEWGSRNFMHSRGEVCSFLQSNANYWLKEYHFDGLRMDAISNMIYWQGNQGRGVNNNAVAFVKYMNQGLKGMYPSVILAAEDSTSFPKVTDSVEQGGLGFDYKWDMGWMNDTLNYMRTAPEYRTQEYHKLTFSMMYYHDARFLLPLSHDEVVHGKATILQKMYGEYEGKFSQARAFYMYMYAHPGKKLNFMGNEFGQLREWDEKRQQDWLLLDYPIHDAFHRFMKKLNEIYMNYAVFSQWDYVDEGFEWLACNREADCLYAFLRRAQEQQLVAIFNFSSEPKEYKADFLGRSLTLLLASDEEEFGGNKKYTAKLIKGMEQIKLEPNSAHYYLVE